MRNVEKKFRPLASPGPIYFQKSSTSKEVSENGDVVELVNFDFVDITAPENRSPMPSPEEYSLSNLIASGNSSALLFYA